MSSSTYSQPLTSSDQSKIFIFGLLLVPSLFFVGIIPVLFLAFGVWMLKKNADFSHMETAVRNFRGYWFIVFAGCALFAAGNVLRVWEGNLDKWDRSYAVESAFAWGVAASIAFGYFTLVKVLFLNPMRGHERWIEANGIFTSKSKAAVPAAKQADVNIVHGGGLSPSYSVADELIKWSKLKDDGHVTLDQYNAAKDKLLASPNR
ncbi:MULTISPECIES: hypothetical protein [unclassified Variovorax]|uniref:hypothetical protein n=1 Tax=unclassified Variovorax TaxID=663243 RepID=UPI00076DBDF6|nr:MULTISPECIES: hypothetical protein [unclassified Variovorax]KWT98102.1 hypothetical protein APY03_0773 [Variovorax sp. WDL1]